MVTDLNEILVFIQVVKTGGIGKAAQILNMPKSTVSRKLSLLEDRLGITLLQRTTRQVRLTRSGEEYFVTCQRALNEIFEAEQAALSTQDTPQGLLRISTPAELGIETAKMFAKFSEKYPLIQIEIDLNNRTVDLVREGFDAALRAGQLVDSSYKSKKIMEGHFILVASPDFISKHKSIREPKDLVDTKCIVFTGRSDPFKWKLQNADGKIVELSLSNQLAVSSAQFCRHLAVEGVGITFVPEQLVRESLQTGELSRVLPKWAGPKGNYHIVYPAQKNIPLKLRVFIDFFSDEFKKKSPA